MIWLYHVIVDYDFALLLLPFSRFQRSHRARFSVNAEVVEPLSYIIHESLLARETNLYVVRRSETTSEETAGSEFPFVNINWFPYRIDCESDESASTFFSSQRILDSMQRLFSIFRPRCRFKLV